MTFNTADVVDPDPRDAEFRRVVALRALYWLQDSIDKNGGCYSGSLVPNFTSVAEILSGATTIRELRLLVEQCPRLGGAE